ncbi:MAG TPA: hypothetical protein DCG33_07530 [Prevotellaceae bacterium]|jgi:hypothetical protein|nr:hypothetical protein [Prevotellaceae bacterium]
MKKHFFHIILTSFMTAICLSSCHIDGTSYDADSEKGYQEAGELILKAVDTNDSKVYYMKFEGSEQNGNNLDFVTIKVVTATNMAYSQKILLAGSQQALPIEEIAHTFEAPIYKDVKGFDIKNFDAKKIIDQIEQAKALIPKNSKFKAISNYTLEEAVPAGNENFNNGVEIGKQTTSFNLSFTMQQPNGSEGFAEVRCIVDEKGKVKYDIE